MSPTSYQLLHPAIYLETCCFLYWDYKDWYASGYNQFTKIDHIVDNTYELAVLESDIGQIVKVNNVGSGGWLLLKKYNNKSTIDFNKVIRFSPLTNEYVFGSIFFR